MTKTVPTGLQALLDSGATTMVYCWRVTRNDAVVQGFTEHDNDLTFDSTTFEAATGFQATAIQTDLGLSVDNLNAEGALSSDTINEEDLAAGRYDGAAVELFWVNFEDVTERVLVMRGSIGQVERQMTAFSAELRSLAHVLQQQTGRTYNRFCDAVLGDARCGVNLNVSSLRALSSVASATDNRQIVSAASIANNSEGFYSFGTLLWTSGLNNGLTSEVKIHTTDGTAAALTFWEKTPFDIAASDTFTVFAGCDKSAETCKSAKFSNLVNFQGFPFIPGNDFITRYPTQGGSDQDGTSIFRT